MRKHQKYCLGPMNTEVGFEETQEQQHVNSLLPDQVSKSTSWRVGQLLLQMPSIQSNPIFSNVVGIQSCVAKTVKLSWSWCSQTNARWLTLTKSFSIFLSSWSVDYCIDQFNVHWCNTSPGAALYSTWSRRKNHPAPSPTRASVPQPLRPPTLP